MMRYLLLLLAGVAYVYSGQIDTPPVDTAAIAGANVNLTCQASGDLSNDRLNWKEHVSDPTGVLIFNSAMTGPNDEEDYDIYGKYNLRIKEVDVEDGGWYSCGLDFMQKPHTVSVMVFEHPTVIMPDLSVGKTATIECRAKYGTPPPAMLQEDQKPGLQVMIEDQMLEGDLTRVNGLPGTPSELKYSVNVTLTKDDHLRTFQCRLNLERPQFQIAERKIMQVRHAVHDIETSPERNMFYVGETIACGATGYPEPSYRWTAVQSPKPRPVSTGKLEIRADMIGENTWRCDASNDAGSGMETVSAEKSFTVVASTTAPPSSSAVTVQTSALVVFLSSLLYKLL